MHFTELKACNNRPNLKALYRAQGLNSHLLRALIICTDGPPDTEVTYLVSQPLVWCSLRCHQGVLPHPPTLSPALTRGQRASNHFPLYTGLVGWVCSTLKGVEQ